MKYKNIVTTIVYMVIDAIVVLLAYLLSVAVAKGIGFDFDFKGLPYALILIIGYKIIMHYGFGLYHMMVKHLDYKSIFRIILVTVVSNVILVILLLIPQTPKFMLKSFYLFITSFEIIALIGYRLFTKLIAFFKNYKGRYINAKKTLIIGAGSAGELALREIEQNKDLNNYVVGFLDDDLVKKGKKISDKKVLGPIKDINKYIEFYNIEEVIMAINHYSKEKINDLLAMINKYERINLKRIAILDNYDENEELKIIDVKVEDLLERDEIKLDMEGISSFIKNEVVLVTGGGGSIGSELCRQIFDLKPRKIIIFDIYENNAYDIQMELERKKFKNPKLKTEIIALIGSVYNKRRIEEVFKIYRPTLVFHAAAYKHVPLMEDSPVEAIRTNVIGTNNVASLALEYKVKKMVLVSSDKAVRPTNVMGATKRYAELIVGYYNTKGTTKYSSVRFGNVLGSNGSVIPLFKKQISDGGPVTVTHKDITRYFMTIPEAVSLILQSALYAEGGEIFILDMGEPVKIYDLAVKMIKLAGLKPNVDIPIEIVGLRPGEKLFEELLVDHSVNDHLKTSHSRIFIEKQITLDYKLLDLDYIISHYEEFDNPHIKMMISKVIKSYKIDGDKDE